MALYRDGKGTPAVIVRKHPAGRTIYLNAVVTDYHRWRMRPPEGENLRLLVEELLSERESRSSTRLPVPTAARRRGSRFTPSAPETSESSASIAIMVCG